MCEETKNIVEVDRKLVFREAFRNAQAMMTNAKKDSKNPFHNSTYASLSAVIDAIRDPFEANGFSICQLMDVRDDGRTIMITKLTHLNGESIESKLMLPDIADPQKVGSAITYYRRYSLMSMAGICAEDDDGNNASRKPKHNYISSQQVADLEHLINGNSEIRQKVLENCNNNLSSITVDRYPGAVRWVESLLANSPEIERFMTDFDILDLNSEASKFIDSISRSLEQPRQKTISDASKEPEKFKENLVKFIEKTKPKDKNEDTR